MLYDLLSSEQFRFAGFGEVGVYALIGFLVVFAGIAFLILVVWGVGKLMAGGKAQGEKNKDGKNDVGSITETAVENVTAVNSEEISEETIAVITAAIMAYYEKNNPKCEFTVKRIKRI